MLIFDREICAESNCRSEALLPANMGLVTNLTLHIYFVVVSEVFFRLFIFSIDRRA